MRPLIILDTNVILSSLQSNKDKAFELISQVGTGMFDCAVSVPLILEYEAVLKNHLDKGIISDSDIEDFIDYLCTAGIKTRIFYLWRPYLKDQFDDHVLELAISAGAERVITYNKKGFRRAEGLGIRIQTPREFLAEMEG